MRVFHRKRLRRFRKIREHASRILHKSAAKFRLRNFAQLGFVRAPRGKAFSIETVVSIEAC